MSPGVFQLGLSIATVLILAGIAWGVQTQTQKQNAAIVEEVKKQMADLKGQINGIGGKMKDQERIVEDRYFALSITLMLIVPKERQEKLADILMSGRRK